MRVMWHIMSYKYHQHLPYSGKPSREKTFANFEVSGLSVKVFSMKIDGHTHSLLVASNNPRKFSPQISYFHQFAKVFSLESFPLYGIERIRETYMQDLHLHCTCTCNITSSICSATWSTVLHIRCTDIQTYTLDLQPRGRNWDNLMRQRIHQELMSCL